MKPYSRVLVAVDLTEECRLVAERARFLASQTDADLHVIHVIEPLSLAYGGDVQMDLSIVQDSINDQANSYLNEFSNAFEIPPENRHLVFGRPEREIHRVAQENDIDVIVVGSHGRHGIALLFGSTANGVLHNAPCDVVAVRVWGSTSIASN